MPDLSGVSRILGSMYVLEGSTLGGQIIARHFRRHVAGLEDGRGCSFFECYGPDVGTRWREFQGVLRAHSSPSADDTMVAAAGETFVLLQSWLHDAVRQADHG
jgi:heme oxygenase